MMISLKVKDPGSWEVIFLLFLPRISLFLLPALVVVVYVSTLFSQKPAPALYSGNLVLVLGLGMKTAIDSDVQGEEH